MKDRKPRLPGRVLISSESGSQHYAVLTMADYPEEEGTPLNKATLLKDETAALYGLDGDAVPDDALRVIKALIDGGVKIDSGSYVGTGKVGSENKNTLSFNFVPRIVAIQSITGPAYMSGGVVHENDGGLLVMVHGSEKAKSFGSNTFYGINTVSWDGNSVSWYCTWQGAYSGASDGKPAGQMNHSGSTYHYVAIG